MLYDLTVFNEKSVQGVSLKVTPALIYHYLKANSEGAGDEFAVPVALPGSEKMFEDFFNAKMINAYFVQTKRNGQTIDAGVATLNAASPDVYVLTGHSKLGEFSKFPFKMREQRKSIFNKELGLELDVTIEDVIQFGCTWSSEEKENVLKTAVREHYNGLNPEKSLPVENLYLKKNDLRL